VTGETSGTDKVGTCTDKAGNTSSQTTVTVKIDLTKPVITGHRNPLPNANGWNNTDVVVTFTCADTGSVQSGIATDTVAGATVSAEGAGQSVTNTGSCIDNAGNTADAATVSNINIDKTAPSISVALDRAPAASGWFNISTGSPTANFTCSDTLSGLDGPCPSSVGPFADGADQTVSGNVSDKAGNSASASLNNIDVDTTIPGISIVAPANGGSYVVNAAVASNYSCSDGTSGVATCAGPVANGSNFDTTIGSHNFTVNASDNAGNTNSATNTYGVTYNVCVLYDQTKAHKRGSTVPIKLYLCDAGGNDVSSASTIVHATTLVKADNSPGILDDSGQANAPDYDFRFDLSLGPSGGYIFNLSTKTLPTGSAMGTWLLKFTVSGEPAGTFHTVQFDVR
jgi:hypothetical protein